MGIEVTRREYVNRSENGEPSDDQNWLLGNVGDWIYHKLQVRFSVKIALDDTSTMQVTNGGTLLILNSGQKWNELGFDIDDTVNLFFNQEDTENNSTGSSSGVSQVRSISGNKMQLNTSISLIPQLTLPSTQGYMRYTGAVVYSTKLPEAVEFRHAYIYNNEVQGAPLNSLIDGTFSRILFKLNGAIEVDGIPLGERSGSAIPFSKAFIIDNQGFDQSGKVPYSLINIRFDSLLYNLYESEIIFNDPQTTAVETGSLTDNFEVIVYPDYNNPNSFVKNDMRDTERLGNTGNFNENYNGLPNKFSISDVSYEKKVDGETLESLWSNGDTVLTFKIKGVEYANRANSYAVVNFAMLFEDESLYKNKTTPFHENVVMNTNGSYSLNTGVLLMADTTYPTVYEGFTAPNGARVDFKNISYQGNGADQSITCSVEILPNAALTSFLSSLPEEDKRYVVWISVGNVSSTANGDNFSDRVSQVVDISTFSDYVPPLGEYSPMRISLRSISQGIGYLDHKCYGDFRTEDNVLARVDFNIRDLEATNFNRIEFGIEMIRRSDFLIYSLQSYSIDLTSYPVDGVEPLWEFEDTRGFELPETFPWNIIRLKRERDQDTRNQKGFVALYPFKIRWAEWAERLGVPSDFVDGDEENNGLHNDWYSYFENGEWTLNFVVYLHAVVNGVSGAYKNVQSFTLKDYETGLQAIDGASPPQVSKWEFYRDESGTRTLLSTLIKSEPLPSSYSGSATILQNEETHVKIQMKIKGNITFNKYMIVSIQSERGAGQSEVRQLGFWDREADNPLINGNGGQRLTSTIILEDGIQPDDKIVVVTSEFKILPQFLKPANSYTLSARVGSKVI